MLTPSEYSVLCNNCLLSLSTVRLKKLDDQNVRKLQALVRWDRDTHDAILWLRENRDKFKMEVFEPPLMVLTVPDRRFVNAVEACFNAAQLKVGTLIPVPSLSSHSPLS